MLKSVEKNDLMLVFYINRRIAWLWFRRRTWQAAKSLGELHANFDPEISDAKTCSFRASREGEIRRELKHLSTGRKRKQ